MSAHTPGPWVVQGFRVYGPTDPRSKHGNGRVLVGGVVDDGIDWRCTQFENPDERGAFYAETMANARLIAAAPELLEALRSIARESNGYDNLSRLGIINEKARAAIAKAEGREP